MNAVAPGPVATDAQADVNRRRNTALEPGERTVGKILDEVRLTTRPFLRLATPQDVAGAFEWLLSDSATYITGHVLVVDGGGVLL